MKISFYLDQNPNLKWRSWTVKNAGLGSSYVSLYYLARELAKRGHDVIIWSHVKFEDIYDGVKMIDLSRYPDSLEDEDVLICCESAPKEIKAKKVINWICRNDDRSLNINSDVNVFVSKFQRDTLKPKFTSKDVVIPHGVDYDLFSKSQTRENFSVIHVGHPIKGFKFLPEIKEKLEDKKKGISVHTWGNGEIWGWDQTQFEPLQKELIKGRVLYHGRRGHSEIAMRLNMARVFIHPVIFEDPFGLAVLEGMAAGCVPIVSEIGNLPKLVEGYGYVIKGVPTDIGWITLAVEKAFELLSNDTLFELKSKACQQQAQTYDWSRVVKKWENLFL